MIQASAMTGNPIPSGLPAGVVVPSGTEVVTAAEVVLVVPGTCVFCEVTDPAAVVVTAVWFTVVLA